MSVDKIEKLDQLLVEYLKTTDESLVDFTLSRLTKPGENYGSIMLKVDIKLRSNHSGSERDLPAVAKLIPSNELILQIFNTQVTYKNEVAFYTTILPTLQEFQREQGVKDSAVLSFAAKRYGSRFNLKDDANVVDNDAVLLLENLRVQGYLPIHRTEGFDLTTAKLILNHISHLHAAGLALKLKKPNVFDDKIRPNLTDYHSSGMLSLVDKMIDEVNTELDPDLIERAKASAANGSDKGVREPWGTVIHNDLWIGNTLIKGHEDAKLVDFQVLEYKSPVRDVLFMIFSSVKIPVLEKHLDELLRFYYERFINYLKCLNVGEEILSRDFSYEEYLKELSTNARLSEFYHVLWMSGAIYADESSVKELNDYTVEDFKTIRMTQPQKNMLSYVIKEFAKRNWI